MIRSSARLFRRGNARRTVFTFAIALAVPLLALSTGTRADTAHAEKPACAWRFHVQAGVPGVALPESNADYFVTPYKLENNQKLELKGKFPSARYMSFNTYNQAGLSVARTTTVDGSDFFPSSLPDTQIVPDVGSNNPWNVTSNKPYGSYTVSVRNTDLPGNNALPASMRAAEAQWGFLVIRMYVRPAAESGTRPTVESGHLPTIRYHNGNRWRPVAPCAITTPIDGQNPILEHFPRIAERVENWADGLANEAGGEINAGDVEFQRFAVDAPFFPNDDTAYVGNAYGNLPDGQVLVVRGKAPTHQVGAEPSVRNREQVRYWSICNYSQEFWFPVVINTTDAGERVMGCKRDQQIKLDDNVISRRYTVVVGKEFYRPRIERLDWGNLTDYATYIPWKRGSVDNHSLQLRHTLPSRRFKPKSTLSVGLPSDPIETRNVMREYYPRAKLCRLTSLENRGPVDCTI